MELELGTEFVRSGVVKESGKKYIDVYSPRGIRKIRVF
jgi:hypothetical protein